MYNLRSIVILAITSLTVLSAGCDSHSAPPGKDPEAVSLPSPEKVIMVRTVPAKVGLLHYVVESNGKVMAGREQAFFAERDGRIASCQIVTGKQVAAGQRLVQFETTELGFRIERASLSRFNAEKEYESQLLGYERLLKEQTQADADAIRKKLRISTGLASSEQDLKELNFEWERSVIRAPFTGTIANLQLAPGMVVKAGQPLFSLYARDPMFLVVKVMEEDALVLKAGMPAKVSAIAQGDHIFSGSVYEINPYIDANGMAEVRIAIAQREGAALFPGMNCTASIEAPGVPALTIPREALVVRNGKQVVFTLEDGLAKWNYVETGRENHSQIEVRKGLVPGQLVIISNNLHLDHDTPVKSE